MIAAMQPQNADKGERRAKFAGCAEAAPAPSGTRFGTCRRIERQMVSGSAAVINTGSSIADRSSQQRHIDRIFSTTNTME
jgi:hypothetical protein